jgi:hypothetical protein
MTATPRNRSRCQLRRDGCAERVTTVVGSHDDHDLSVWHACEHCAAIYADEAPEC